MGCERCAIRMADVHVYVSEVCCCVVVVLDMCVLGCIVITVMMVV